ncbi:MAG: ATPase, T2SS/T4P/T4SS family [Archangium sp.]
MNSSTNVEGLVVRTRFLAKEFVPFDDVSALDGSAMLTQNGARHALQRDAAELTRAALSPPPATGVLTDDGAAFARYLAGAWSPVRAVRSLIDMASRSGASDVHVESDARDTVTVSLRRFGELVPFTTLPRAAGERLLAALKQVSGCLPYRRDLAQEGRIQRDGVAADVRTAFLPTALGERGALRLFGKLLTLEQLGFDTAVLEGMREALDAKHGLILVAGASGAGKTTTLYAALAHVAKQRGGAHLSLEDPVEQRLRVAGIPVAQVELCPERGLTAESALVAALRQDLDVLAVGEIRTAAEAQLAVRAAHTGRLVLAGLHAGTPDEATQRMLELGVERAVLEKTLLATLHQSLQRVGAEKLEPRGTLKRGVS